MDANQSSKRNLWIALGALFIGLVIGLVVLGWWLFPVQWTDASPEDLVGDYQVDYLLAAVDSFWVTFDSNTALQRYQSLGEDGPSALATIQADPSANPTEVAAYSAVVEAGQEQGYIEEPAQVGLGDVGKILIALLLIVLAAGLLVWLLSRGGGQGAGEAPASGESDLEEPTGEAPLGEAAGGEGTLVEETPAEELGDEGFAGEAVAAAGLAAAALDEATPESGDTAPVRVESGDTHPVVVQAEEPPPPLWLPEEEPESGFGLGRAAAVAGLAGVAATTGEQEQAAQVEEETLAETAPLGGAGALAAGTVAAAALGGEEPAEPVDLFEDLPVEPPLDEAGMDLAAVAGVAAVLPEAEAGKGEGLPGEQVPAGTAVYEPAKMDYGLAYIEGIGPVFAEKLAEFGITTPGELLEAGATPRGRQDLAEKTGISGRLILEWVNHVDLFRIKGVGSEYADLLEAAGVDTVIELAMRNPDHLFNSLVALNETKHLVRKLPVLDQVRDWIDQAKDLPRKIYY